MKAKRTKNQPTVISSTSTTKNKEAALRDIAGTWENRKEVENVKKFRNQLWRKTE